MRPFTLVVLLEAAPVPEPWELPGHVQRQIAALQAKASTEKRELTEDELLLFSGLPLKGAKGAAHESAEHASHDEKVEQSVANEEAEVEELQDAAVAEEAEGETVVTEDAAQESVEAGSEVSEPEAAAAEEPEVAADVVAAPAPEPIEAASSEAVEAPVVAEVPVSEPVAAEDLQADIDAMIAAQQSDEVAPTVDSSPGSFVEKAILEELAAIDRLIEELNAQG